ncbi:hypothetical protein [Psychroserpens algicola]|uniref:Rho termination factor N-terminal domain-containing protein n=1 Tax=Psychroserpens algicola TaxID=1719034 RepID=A0ABT0H967_9FLAO|nr:hypothetical protein [Psychroserpens algicola]MCK8480914.1 hypothetical protein [Psychroserpens algicola]
MYRLFSLVTLLLVLSCGDNNNTYSESNEDKNEGFIENAYSEEELLELEKDAIVAFYNNIGFEIIGLILKDRVYETNPEKSPLLKGVALDDYPSRLTDSIYEKKVKLYSERLIEIRNGFIDSIVNETILSDFENSKVVLLQSPFFNDTIIGKDPNGLTREDEPEYMSLVDIINKKADEVSTRLSEIKDQSKIESNAIEESSKEKQDIANEKKETKENSMLWMSLLGASVLLNVVQFILFRNKTKNIEDYPNDNETEYFEENSKEYERGSQQKFATSIPAKLKSTRVEKIVDEAYDKMRQLLSDKYHQDCVKLISNEWDSFRLKGLNSLKSKSFKDRLEVEKSIKSIIDHHQSILERELEMCIPKSKAETDIENTVKRDNFNEVANIELLSEDEINSIIQQMKQATLFGLSVTMNKHQLVAKIDELEENIIETLQNKIKDGLVYYFPFTDVNGSLDDKKKTKVIERDSAIKLSINNEDMSKATFTLLYEEDDMMQAGIMSYDSFLIPICELKSEDFNSTGTRIEQTGNDGTMELVDGYWKVKNKLPIKVI